METTSDGIKKAFRRIALELHPDRQSSADAAAAAELFSAVRSAYETLLAEFEAKETGASPSEGLSGSSSWAQDWANLCKRDARSLFAGGSSKGGAAAYTVSHGVGGGGGIGQVIEPLDLTLAQVMRGANLPFAPAKLSPCTGCGGRGHVHRHSDTGGPPRTCGTCDGHGYRLGSRRTHLHYMGEQFSGGPSADQDAHPHAGFDAVQYTCAACCGTGVEIQACPVCNGTGMMGETIPGTLIIPGGLKAGVTIAVDDHFRPGDGQGSSGPDAANSTAATDTADGEADGCEADGDPQPGSRGCSAKPKAHWMPSHLKISYNSSWDSTRGFSVVHPNLVKVVKMSLLRYCRTRNVKVTLPTGDAHMLGLGPSEHLDDGGAGSRKRRAAGRRAVAIAKGRFNNTFSNSTAGLIRGNTISPVNSTVLVGSGGEIAPPVVIQVELPPVVPRFNATAGPGMVSDELGPVAATVPTAYSPIELTQVDEQGQPLHPQENEGVGRRESSRAARTLAGVQTLRLNGQGVPQSVREGVQTVGDAVLLLRLAFPDRLGQAESDLLYGCFGESEVHVGLIRGTAALIAGVRAGLAADQHDVEGMRWARGLHVTTAAADPMTTVIRRWAWWGP